MFETREVKIGSVDYQAGGVKTIELPKDFPYAALRCRLSGRLAITGGTTSGTPWAENPMTLIRRIRLFGTKAGGAVEIINCDAASLYRLGHIFTEVAPEIANVNSGAAANYDFVATINLPLHILGKKIKDAVKKLSLLPGFWFDQLQLEIQWRDGSQTADGGLISAGDRALALTAYGSAGGSPSISVVAIQAVSINPKTLNPALLKIYKKTLVTEAVESARKEQLNRGNFYRALVFKTYSDTAERAVADTIMLNSKLLISGNAKVDFPLPDLKSRNKDLYSLESMPTGYSVLDFAPEGYAETFLDTSKFTDNGTSLEVELNINGAANNRVDVISLEVVQPGKW